jgi:hypothetical protein
MAFDEPIELVNEALIRNKIPLSAVIRCAQKNSPYIENMQSIFDCKTPEDTALLQAIPGLLAQGKAEKPISDNDKLLLLTALVENPDFLTMSLNWCGLLRSRVMKVTSTELGDNEKTQRPRRPSIFQGRFNIEKTMVSQAAKEAGFHDFGEKTEIPGIGTLTQDAGEIQGSPYIVFSLELCKNVTISRPCIIEVELTTLKDNKTITVKIEDDGEGQSIRSKPFAADYTAGIKIRI